MWLRHLCSLRSDVYLRLMIYLVEGDVGVGTVKNLPPPVADGNMPETSSTEPVRGSRRKFGKLAAAGGIFFFSLPLLSTDFFCTSRQVLMKVNSSRSAVLCRCTVSEKPGRNKQRPYQNIGLLKTNRHASHLHMSGGGHLVDI